MEERAGVIGLTYSKIIKKRKCCTSIAKAHLTFTPGYWRRLYLKRVKRRKGDSFNG